MASYEDEVLADSPYLYWRFADLSGTTAEDASPNNRDGTYNGGPTLVQASALTDPNDYSVDFDATNDYCRSNVTLNTAPVTVSVWFEYSGTPPGSDSWICGFASGDGGAQWDKVLDMDTSGRVRFYIFDGTTRWTSVGSPLSAGWHHLVGTVPSGAGGTSRCYVDGVEVGTHNPTNGSFTGYGVNNILVGGTSAGYARLAGKRDEFAVFTTDIAPSRISDHYEAGVQYITPVHRIINMF